MDSPVSAQILARMMGALATIPGIAELGLMPPGDPARFPALIVDDEGEEVVSQDHYVMRALLAVSVVGYLQGADAHAAARRLDAEVMARMMAFQTFDGLATMVNVGALAIEPVELGQQRTVGFQRNYTIDFSYETTNPSQPAG